MTPKTMQHPETGQWLYQGWREKIFPGPGGKPIRIEVPGWYPDDEDGDSIHTAEDMLDLELKLKKMRS